MILENYLNMLQEIESACNGKQLKNLIIARCKDPEGIVLAYPIGEAARHSRFGYFHLRTTLILAKQKGKNNKYVVHNWWIPGIAAWIYHKQYSVTEPYQCNYLDFAYADAFVKQSPIKLIEYGKCIRTQTRSGITLSKIQADSIKSDSIVIQRKQGFKKLEVMTGRLSDNLHNELPEGRI